MVRVHKRPQARPDSSSADETLGLTRLRRVGPSTTASLGGTRAVAASPLVPVVARSREQARAAGLLGAVAQLVERLLCKEEVRSSSLLGSTAHEVACPAGTRFTPRGIVSIM